MESQLSTGIILFFLVLTARDFLVGPVAGGSGAANEEEVAAQRSSKVPASRLGTSGGASGSGLSINRVHILYCTSCGYRKAYDEVSQIIQHHYPDIDVTGDNYPTSAISQLLNSIIGLGKMVLIGLVLSGTNPFPMLGMATPSIWFSMQQRKMMTCMMTFFISNAIQTQLVSSGAFEISFNNIPIWSKLETGRVPSPSELIQIMDAHHSFKQAPSF